MNHFRQSFSKHLLKTWSGKCKSYISTLLLKLPQGLSSYPSIFHGSWGWKRAHRCLAHISANTKLLHAVFWEVCPVFNRVKKLPPFLPMEKLFPIIKDFTAEKQFLTLSLKYSLADIFTSLVFKSKMLFYSWMTQWFLTSRVHFSCWFHSCFWIQECFRWLRLGKRAEGTIESSGWCKVHYYLLNSSFCRTK